MSNYPSLISDANQVELFAFTEDAIPSVGSTLRIFVDLPSHLKISSSPIQKSTATGSSSQEHFVILQITLEPDTSSERKIQEASVTLTQPEINVLSQTRQTSSTQSHSIGNYLIEVLDTNGTSVKKKTIAANASTDPTLLPYAK